MSYKRKTRDVWHVQQYTGNLYGWETVTCEDWRQEAHVRLREYQANQPEYLARIVLRRERIAEREALEGR